MHQKDDGPLSFGCMFETIVKSFYGLAESRLLRGQWSKDVFARCYFAYKKFYEDSLLSLFKLQSDILGDGDILDIGANIGYTSCLFATRVKPRRRIYSFEPDSANFDVLVEVVRKRNLFGIVVPIRKAVSDCDGSVEFWHNSHHSGDHRVVTTNFRQFGLDSSYISTTPSISVDTFVRSENLENVSFAKIDVQGYELAVCRGMQQTLGRFPRMTVCIEYAPSALRELGFDPQELLAFFRDRGFLIHILTRSRMERVLEDSQIEDALQKRNYIDVVCSKRGLV